LCLANDKVTWEAESRVTREMVEEYEKQEEECSNKLQYQNTEDDSKRRRTDVQNETAIMQG